MRTFCPAVLLLAQPVHAQQGPQTDATTPLHRCARTTRSLTASRGLNARGQVEGTCVGTGMAFDPAFYYFRPVSPYAAHGYVPALLAGAEVIKLLKSRKFEIDDSSLQLLQPKRAEED